MNVLIKSSIFDAGLNRLKDDLAVAAIIKRITAAESGNFGDFKPIGEGVSEMRIHHGPGYRVYYMRRGKVVYYLLCGGNKSSQARDIKRALELAEMVKAEL